jgi:hypothetical protein
MKIVLLFFPTAIERWFIELVDAAAIQAELKKSKIRIAKKPS